MAFQLFISPPGDRLLKWQLAGVTAIDHHSFLHDLVAQYEASPLHSLVLNKLFNVRNLAGSPSLWRNVTALPTWHGWIGAARVASLTALLWSAGLLVLGALGLVS